MFGICYMQVPGPTMSHFNDPPLGSFPCSDLASSRSEQNRSAEAKAHFVFFLGSSAPAASLALQFRLPLESPDVRDLGLSHFLSMARFYFFSALKTFLLSHISSLPTLQQANKFRSPATTPLINQNLKARKSDDTTPKDCQDIEHLLKTLRG